MSYRQCLDMRKTALSSFIVICHALVNPLQGQDLAVDHRADWAPAVQIEGLPNLHKVSDTLYRCAQPSAVGLQNAKKLGIETVVSLRAFHSDKDEIGQTGLKYQHLGTRPKRVAQLSKAC